MASSVSHHLYANIFTILLMLYKLIYYTSIMTWVLHIPKLMFSTNMVSIKIVFSLHNEVNIASLICFSKPIISTSCNMLSTTLSFY